MDAIFGLFNLLALIYIFRGAQVVWRIIREWQTLKQEPLNREKKSLAEQASFFVAVPPSVAFHEFCHALATWLVGGRIVDFGYGGFWGYVVPVGNFTAAESWFIAVAGTLGTLLFGTAVYLLFRHHPASSFRYFGLRAFRFQLYFALVYYPIFTIFVPTISDWRTIYNFSATPVLSVVTAVTHIVLLYIFYTADRRGWFEMAGFETVTEQAQFAALEQQAAQNPQDPQVAMSLIEGWRRGGAMHKATTVLKRYLQTHPNDADAYALLAAFQMNNNEHVSSECLANAQKALELGVANPRRRATAYRILGQYALERNRYPEAVNQFSDGIAALTAANQEIENQSYQAYLYHLRSQAYRRQNQYEEAYQDVQQAIQLAQANGDEKQAAFFRQELDIIEQHAGRPLGISHNPPSRQDVI